MNFKTLQLTNAGAQLLSKELSGETTICLVRMECGDGIANDAQKVNTLVNKVIEVPILNQSRNGEIITVEGTLTNEELEREFRWTELGIIAEDNEGTETLLYYTSANGGVGTAIPANEGTTKIEIAIRAQMVIGAASNISVSVKDRVYASREELETHAKNKENPHKVTAEQVGLEKVQNVSTNDQTPTYQSREELSELVSGEKLSTAMSKIACAVKQVIEQKGKVITGKSGVSGNWTYRKYDDGTIDLWYRKTIETMATAQTGYAFKTGEITLDDLPFEIQEPVKYMHFIPSTAYIAWPIETNKGTVELYRHNNGTVSGTITVMIHGNYTET